MANGKGRNKKRHRVTKAPMSGVQQNTLKQEPLLVAVQLSFTDPDGEVRSFPKGFPVTVKYGKDEKTENHKIDNDEGNLIFTVLRSDAIRYNYIRLHFSPADNNYILCEKRGEAIKTTVIANSNTANEKSKNGQRFFRLPSKWSFLSSDWEVAADEKIFKKAEKEKYFLLTEEGKPRGIGTKSAPVKAVLNPHWQFVKFEYFDRYYGHTDHDNKPIGIAQIALDGFFKAKAGDTKADKGDTRSNWTIVQDADEKKVIQCLPWILQAKDDGTPQPKPNKDIMLQFTQPKDTFIVSNSATERKIVPELTQPLTGTKATEHGDNLKPCANRLKYYDLPELWKSMKYWCRLSDEKTEKDFFEKMADKKTEKAKPLIFSLDDIVLTDDRIAPLSIQDTDKLGVFYHEFIEAGVKGGRAGATYLKDGLYKPGPDLSDIKGQAKLEKEARDKAEAGKKKREEQDARQLAEANAKKAGLKGEEITKAGDKAVLDVANDPEAQKRIKEVGDSAAAGATKSALKSGKIKQSTDNVKLLALEPNEIIGRAKSKQRAVEEQPLRQAAEDRQRKIEESRARKEAMAEARKSGYSEKSIQAAGEKAVADLVNDKDAQNRIKTAGNNATVQVSSDNEAKKRINEKGSAAEKDALAFPFSDITRHEEFPNYISDYPHWSRLVVYKGNLFDVFDKRTKSGDVIGARAAVRWVDATDSGVGIPVGSDVAAMPAIVPALAQQSTSYMIEQPFMQQAFFSRTSTRPKNFYDEWAAPTGDGGGWIYKNARFDLALIRCSNYQGNNEETAVFRYKRISFDFTTYPSEIGDALPPPSTRYNPPYREADADKRKVLRERWVKEFIIECANRWNGNDNVNTSRAWIVEDKPADPKLRANIVTFLQQLSDDKAHFKIDMKAEGSWMAASATTTSRGGTGVFEVEDGRDTTGMSFEQGFAGAHEIGHAGGQPDDYAPSVKGVPGFSSNHTPGTPFILDVNAMMKANKQVRGRSFWYLTEWLRQLNPFTASKFQVEHAGYTYKIPHYNHAGHSERNYTHWAVKAQTYYKPAVPFHYDSYLYFLGHDEFSRVVLPSQPDGIIVIMIKLLFKFNGYTDNDRIIKHIFSRVNQKINTALNNTRVHAQFNLPGIDRGTPNTFEKCMLHFSPRFEVNDSLSSHLKITIKVPPDPPAATVLPVAPTSANNFYYSSGGVIGPNNMAGLYGLIRSGTITPTTQVHDGTNWQEANNIPALKTLFDVYYWYDDGGLQGPKTLKEMYDLAKAETIKWDTEVSGPGWIAAKNADKFPDLLPPLKRWFHEPNVGPFTEIQMHGNFATVPIEEDTDVCGEPTDNNWKAAKEWAELEEKFTKNSTPRKLDFRFPINPGSLGALNPVVTHLEDKILECVCKMLGLSVKSTEVNYYGNADAYKGIVKGVVNNNALNPTMSRP